MPLVPAERRDEGGGLPPRHPFANVHVGGLVYDARSRDGIEGAWVTIGPMHGEPRLGPRDGDGRIGTRTRRDGSYALRGVPPGLFELTASAPGYVSASSTLEKWSTVEDDDGFDFGLVPARLVEGVVRTEEGAKVVGAEVFPIAPDGSAGPADRTDRSGRFVLDQVITTVTRIVATHGARGTGGVVLPPGEDRAWVEVVLSNRRARGVVRSAQGPLEGASLVVELQRAAGIRLPREGPAVTTGEDGTFEIGLPAGGPAVLRAEAPGHVLERAVIEDVTTAEVHDVALVLEAGVRFSGRVVTDDGAAVHGAAVRVAAGPVAHTTRTDSAGRFHLDGLPPAGPYGVEVHHHRYPPYGAVEAQLGVGHEILLEAPAVVFGHVLDAAAGGPITSYSYTLLGPLEKRGHGVSQSGAFEVGRLVPGRYRLTLEADGYLPASADVTIGAPSDRVEVSLHLDPAGGLAGRVRGARNTFVSVWRGKRHVASTRTDEEGNFFVGELEPGQYRLVAESSEGRGVLTDVRVQTGQTTTNLMIELRPAP